MQLNVLKYFRIGTSSCLYGHIKQLCSTLKPRELLDWVRVTKKETYCLELGLSNISSQFVCIYKLIHVLYSTGFKIYDRRCLEGIVNLEFCNLTFPGPFHSVHFITILSRPLFIFYTWLHTHIETKLLDSLFDLHLQKEVKRNREVQNTSTVR